MFDINELEEYPFYGEFYKDVFDQFGDGSYDREVILATVCDIQLKKASSSTTFTNATHVVYYPKDTDIEIEDGLKFSSNMYGLGVSGLVVGIIPNPLGSVEVYIKST